MLITGLDLGRLNPRCFGLSAALKKADPIVDMSSRISWKIDENILKNGKIQKEFS